MSTFKTYHMCMSIRGLLKKPKKSLAGLFTKEDGTKANAEETHDYLLDQLSQGKEVLPMGKCDNFDFKEGCKGHEHEESL